MQYLIRRNINGYVIGSLLVQFESDEAAISYADELQTKLNTDFTHLDGKGYRAPCASVEALRLIYKGEPVRSTKRKKAKEVKEATA